MKRLVLPLIALTLCPPAHAFWFGQWDHYPSAYEASQACRKWRAQTEGVRCMPDSTFVVANKWNNGFTKTILGIQGVEVIRRFKWTSQ